MNIFITSHIFHIEPLLNFVMFYLNLRLMLLDFYRKEDINRLLQNLSQNDNQQQSLRRLPIVL